MANRYPLIVDSSSQQIKEFPSGDTLVIDNLQVTGTTTTLETATLNVEDKNITINYSTGDSSSTADGSGLTFQDAVDASTDATILWGTTNDRFQFSHGIEVTSGNVGIGTTSPSSTLEISKNDQTNGATLSITNSFDGSDWSSGDIVGTINFRVDDGSTTEKIRGQIKLFDDGSGSTTFPAYNAMSFSTANNNTLSERMRLDSSGNLLVGTTSVNPGLGNTNEGHSLNASGAAIHSADGNNALRVNRNTSDGTVITIAKDGSTVGSIGTSGGRVTIGHDDAGLKFNGQFDTIHPFNMTTNSNSDAVVSLGNGSQRFKDLYLSGTAKVDSSAYISQGALTSSSNAVAWDAAAKANAYYATTQNTTFSAPTNAVEGAIISVEIAQGATPYTVAWNTVFEFAASTAPTMTATANKTDILSFRYNGSVWQEIGRVQNLAQT